MQQDVQRFIELKERNMFRSWNCERKWYRCLVKTWPNTDIVIVHFSPNSGIFTLQIKCHTKLFHSRSSTYDWAIVASLRSMKCSDCLRWFCQQFRTQFHHDIQSQAIWDLVSWQRLRSRQTCKTWDVSTWVLSQLESEIFNSKYHTTGDTQRHLVDLRCCHVIFWGTLSGERMPYRCPGSHCYGLLRKRQNGGRPEAQRYYQLTGMWIRKNISIWVFPK